MSKSALWTRTAHSGITEDDYAHHKHMTQISVINIALHCSELAFPLTGLLGCFRLESRSAPLPPVIKMGGIIKVQLCQLYAFSLRL